MARRALMVGRFQPFHNGHLESVRRIAADFDEIILAIGSADASHTLKNPFTAGERFEMIRAACADAGVPNVVVIPVPDLNRNPLWVAHVRSLVPRFDVFFTNNALPKRLFQEAGFEVRPIPFVDRVNLEGTRVRDLMRAGDAEWEKLVPRAVTRIVSEVRGLERIRALAEDDVARAVARDDGSSPRA